MTVLRHKHISKHVNVSKDARWCAMLVPGARRYHLYTVYCTGVHRETQADWFWLSGPIETVTTASHKRPGNPLRSRLKYLMVTTACCFLVVRFCSIFVADIILQLSWLCHRVLCKCQRHLGVLTSHRSWSSDEASHAKGDHKVVIMSILSHLSLQHSAA